MIRAFVPADLAALNTWAAARGLSALPLGILPPNGFIVPDTAAGFLYLTDAGLAFSHNFITNPAVPGPDRYAALVAIREAVIARARDLGVQHLMGWSNNPTAIKLATDRGAKVVDTNLTLHVAVVPPRST